MCCSKNSPSFNGTQKFIAIFARSRPLDANLIRMNQVHSLASYFYNIPFNIIPSATPTTSMLSLHLRSFCKNCIYVFYLSHTCKLHRRIESECKGMYELLKHMLQILIGDEYEEKSELNINLLSHLQIYEKELLY